MTVDEFAKRVIGLARVFPRTWTLFCGAPENKTDSVPDADKDFQEWFMFFSLLSYTKQTPEAIEEHLRSEEEKQKATRS